MTRETDVAPARIFTKADCTNLAAQLTGFVRGGGSTVVSIESRWTAATRWARNRIRGASDVSTVDLTVSRTVRGASAQVTTNQCDAPALQAAVTRAERLLTFQPEQHDGDLRQEVPERYTWPTLWSEPTYTLDPEARAAVVRRVMANANASGMLAAGALTVSANGRALISSLGQLLYFPYTTAVCSITVRDPVGEASGWAGRDHHDWAMLDAVGLAERALEKCLASRNPVAIEPGRYTTILEPQAVCDLLSDFFRPGFGGPFDRAAAERDPDHVFHKSPNATRWEEPVFDSRLSVREQNNDPGFPPFSTGLSPDIYDLGYNFWILSGRLHCMGWDRTYALNTLGVGRYKRPSGSFRMMNAGTSHDGRAEVSQADMIATTARGLVVTRFTDVQLVDRRTWLLTGATRDGVWLVERGKISRPVKNFRFLESPLTAFNQVEVWGVAERVLRPAAPAICMAAKVREFNFTQLADAG